MRQLSSCAITFNHVVKIFVTVVAEIPNVWAMSMLVEPRRSFINVNRNSSFPVRQRFLPCFFGDCLKGRVFVETFEGPFQYEIFLTFCFTNENKKSKVDLFGIHVKALIVLSFLKSL